MHKHLITFQEHCFVVLLVPHFSVRVLARGGVYATTLPSPLSHAIPILYWMTENVVHVTHEYTI